MVNFKIFFSLHYYIYNYIFKFFFFSNDDNFIYPHIYCPDQSTLPRKQFPAMTSSRDTDGSPRSNFFILKNMKNHRFCLIINKKIPRNAINQRRRNSTGTDLSLWIWTQSSPLAQRCVKSRVAAGGIVTCGDHSQIATVSHRR